MGVAPDVLRAAVELYLALHTHPEPAGAEERTAARLAAWLRADGYDVTTGVGGHGVAGVLRRGDGPVVMLRAELDALPVREETGLAYASAIPGMMHACGHDLHLAALAGAARALARDGESWRGTLLVVGQPAEETLTGARDMLTAGLYGLCGVPDAVLAQHAAPLPAGTVAHARGPVLAGSRTLDAVLHGTGGHGGTPHLTVDPVLAAAAAVLRLQGIVSRETAPSEQAVLTVGRLRAGELANVVPDRAELSLSLRAFGEETLERMTDAVRRVLRAESDASGCPRPPELTVTARSPVLVPDAELTGRVRAAHARRLGAGAVLEWQPSTAAEDFPWFGPAGAELHGGAAVRTAYWMLGTVRAARWRAAREPGAPPLPGNHSPAFAPDVRTALPTGIGALADAAREALGAGVPSRRVGAG
ncbi:amidohydrolase [Streptomyces avicenniae]|uniref:amidohydrolase n=1 Tax=Streptomyces avicenniae TaxID=500153 RepID=UPI000699CA79|nr:amidohydrolase [Streptomyces avicenniae]